MASKETRYKEERNIRILKEVETGTSVVEVCRTHSASSIRIFRGDQNRRKE